MAETRNDALPIDEEVGQYGLQDEDTEAFFHTKEGIKLIAEFVEKMNEEIEEEEELAFLRAEEAQMKKDALAGLALEMDEEKKEKRERRHEGVERHHLQPLHHPEEAASSSHEYEPIEFDFEPQRRELRDVEQERAKANKRYDQYGKNLKEADDFIGALNPRNKQQTEDALQAKMDKLEKEIDVESDAARKLVDSGKYEEARTTLDALNAKNLQMGTLKDMMSVTKGDKEMYNNNGEKVDSFKDADFVVPKDKKLVKEGEQLHLLGKDEPLTDKNRDAAKADFLRARPEMSSVKNLVNSNREIEMGSLAAKESRLQGEIKQQQGSKAAVEPTAAVSAVSRPQPMAMGSLQPMPDSPSHLNHLHDDDPEHKHLTKPS